MGNILGAIAGGAAIAITIKAIDDFSSTFKRATTGTGKLGAAFSAMAKIGVAATVALAAGLAKVAISSISAASDFEETASKFAVVFSSVTTEAEKMAKNLADNFGLSSKASKQLLGDTGDLLTGFGFTQESALDLSNEVNKLAVDLASFTNFSGGAEGASAALTKALLGERESVKSLGIAILEEDVKAKIISMQATGELTNETERQMKAIATLAIAMEQSKNAIGDFARTEDSLANQTRILKANFEDLQVELGTALIPVAKELVGVLIDEVLPAIQPLIPVLGDFLAKAIKFLIPLIKNSAEQFMILADFIFNDLMPVIEPLIPILMDIGRTLFDTAMKVLQALMPAFKALLPPIIRIIEALLPFIDLLAEVIVIAAELIGQFAENLGPVIEMVADRFETIAPIMFKIIGAIVSFISVIAGLIGKIFEIAGAVFDFMKPAFDWMNDKFQLIIGPIKTLIEWYDKLIGKIKSFLGMDDKSDKKSSKSSSKSSSRSSSSNSSRSSSSRSSISSGSSSSSSSDRDSKRAPVIHLNDFIVTKKGQIIKPSSQDTIMGTKNPGQIGGGMTLIIQGDVNGVDPDAIASSLAKKLKQSIRI